MRYSLLTLVVVTLWIALAMLVWARREPWVLLTDSYSEVQLRQVFPSVVNVPTNRTIAPDGRRMLGTKSHSTLGLYALYEIQNSEIINDDFYLLLEPADPASNYESKFLGFIDDDHIVFVEEPNISASSPTQSNVTYHVWHRRHPEWWWGHFYRPEVWALIALTVFLFVFAVRSRLKRRIESA